MPTFEFFRLKTGKYPHPTGSTHSITLPRLSNGWLSQRKDMPCPVFPGGHSVFTKELKAIAIRADKHIFICHSLGLYIPYIKLDCYTA